MEKPVQYDLNEMSGYFFTGDEIPPPLREICNSIVSIRNKTEYVGSGFIVGEAEKKYLISAAHCFKKNNDLGKSELEERSAVFASGDKIMLEPEQALVIPEKPFDLRFVDVIAFRLADSSVSSSSSLRLSARSTPDQLPIGMPVVTVGFPYRYLQEYNLDILPVVSVGRIIDSPYRGEFHFRTDCRVEEGNSGGPVIDSSGEVIGVIYALSPRTPFLWFDSELARETRILDNMSSAYPTSLFLKYGILGSPRIFDADTRDHIGFLSNPGQDPNAS